MGLSQHIRPESEHQTCLRSSPRFLAIEFKVSPLRTVYGLTLKEATMTCGLLDTARCSTCQAGEHLAHSVGYGVILSNIAIKAQDLPEVQDIGPSR